MAWGYFELGVTELGKASAKKFVYHIEIVWDDTGSFNRSYSNVPAGFTGNTLGLNKLYRWMNVRKRRNFYPRRCFPLSGRTLQCLPTTSTYS
jgi:hypothetical protein